MRPPGHSGKAKQGHLCFNAAFETGTKYFCFSRDCTDLLTSNFHEKELCAQTVMYIFEWHFRME